MCDGFLSFVARSKTEIAMVDGPFGIFGIFGSKIVVLLWLTHGLMGY